MNIIEIIDLKKKGQTLSQAQIEYFINAYTNDLIKDYQASSLLMAILIQGMNDEETTYLTKAMYQSGDILDLSSIKGLKYDKHSTGGVGDKVTLILAPLLASCNFKLAKLSGKGLGHTGGTIDKLEAIPGFKTNLSLDEFINQVNEINVAIAGQTNNLVPADKKLYALRDVCGCIDSIPLIASSIMSKKIASGSDVILLDVKVGSGAFMKDLSHAQQLASLMVKIGTNLNRKMLAVITDMDNPLGYNIGNNLEIIEVIELLNNRG
ncbi:MAG: thymidine phosphorylase, partial [Bacilli bacterium]